MSIENTLEMPKTAREQLEELEIGKSILVGEEFTRTTLANNVTTMHKDFPEKQFKIRTNKKTKEVRVWRKR